MDYEIVAHAANCVTNIIMCFVWSKMLESKVKSIYSWSILLGMTVIQELYVILIGRNDLLSVISLFFYISFIFFMFKNSVKEKLIVFSYSYFSIAITDIIFTVTIKFLEIDSGYEMFISFMFYYSFYLLMCRNLWSIRDILFDTKINIRIMSVLFLLPIHILFVNMAFSSIMRDGKEHILYREMVDGLNNYNIISLVLILVANILFIILYSFIMNAVKNEIYSNKIKSSVEELKCKNEEQYKYYSDIQSRYNSARKYRHDLNNILSVLNFLDQNNLNDKDKIILQLQNSIKQLSEKQEK